MPTVGSSEWLWKEGGGYYTEAAEDLARRPLLPDLGRLRDRRILELFEKHGNISTGSRVLEVGCGRSRWLPFIARRFGCSVVGIDIEPFAADLARANLAGAGAAGEILCGDAFAIEGGEGLRGTFDLIYSMGLIEHFDDASRRLALLATYLRPQGRILTTVPNLRGVNWVLQRLGDLKTLEIHVIYDARRLAQAHEAAGFDTLATGYAGFCDGFVSSAAGTSSRLRRLLHHRLCWLLSISSEAWVRFGHGRATPEMSLVAPHVFYVGRRPQ